MKSHIENSKSADNSPGISRWLDEGTLFLRHIDKQKLVEVPNVLAGTAPYIALTSGHPKLLNHYFNYLYECIREDYRFEVEVFFSVTVDSILEFYNSRLSDVSLNNAREERAGTSGRKIMVIADSASMSEQERDLLERLLVDFPGANCGLLLVSEKLHSEFSEKFLNNTRLKPTVLNVDLPQEEELQDIFSASLRDSDGHEQRINKLRELELPLPERASAGNSILGAEEDYILKKDGNVSDNKIRKRFFFGLVFSAVAAAGIAIVLNGNFSDPSVMEDSFSGVKQEPPPPIAPEVKENTENSEKIVSVVDSLEAASETIDVIEEDFVLPGIEDGLTAQKSNLGATDTGSFEGAPNFLERQQNAAQETEKDPQKSMVAELTQTLEQNSQETDTEALVVPSDSENSIDSTGFYVQHGAYQLEENALNALAWAKQSFPLAFVIPQKMSGSEWYVILSGAYVSREQAEDLSKEKRPSADVWIITGDLVISRSLSE